MRPGNTTHIWTSGHEGFTIRIFRRGLNEIVDSSGERILWFSLTTEESRVAFESKV